MAVKIKVVHAASLQDTNGAVFPIQEALHCPGIKAISADYGYLRRGIY